MRILIIGGTRFMGPYIVRRLIEAGHTVTVFHRGVSVATLPGEVRHILGDRRNLNDFRPGFARLAPDAVLDMYLMSEQDALDSTRVFSGIAGRLVVASSMDVYRAYGVLLGLEAGLPVPVPLTEDSELRTRLYPYRGVADKPADRTDDYDKIPAEQIVLAQPSLPGTILRLPMVYGPGDPRHRLYPYLRRMNSGREAIVLPESVARWRGVWGYVENVALALALAVTDARAAGQVFHVAELQPVSELERLTRLAGRAGWPGRFVVVPDARVPDWSPPLNLAQHWTADSSRIRQELGYYEAVDLDEGIGRTVAWQQRHLPDDTRELRESPFLLDEALEDELLAA